MIESFIFNNDKYEIISKEYGTFYYKNHKLHREDGPAQEWDDGNKHWFFNGNYHRLDGPAVEYCNGTKAWFYHGKYINCKSQEEFERLIKLKAFW